jgi:Calcineurin-like phosphoesterase
MNSRGSVTTVTVARSDTSYADFRPLESCYRLARGGREKDVMATPALNTGYTAKDGSRAKLFAIVNRLMAFCNLLVFILLLPSFTRAQDFTIVILPDPQNATQSFPQVLNSQMQWVVDNRQRLNIQIVLDEGDTVNDGAMTAQWQNADAAFRLLDNAGIPYLLALGNHDYNGFAPKVSRDLAGFNQWFGPARFFGKEFYRGSFPPGSNANSYGVLTINGKQYLFMALEYRPTAAALDWAETILVANPDKEAILAVHSYLLSAGYREDLCDSQDMPGGNANGQEVWARLRKYANVEMVVGGHFTGGTGARRADLGDKNNLVNQMFANSSVLVVTAATAGCESSPFIL